MLRTTLALLLATTAVVGCENQHSRLDDVAKTGAKAQAANPGPGAAPVNTQADHSGDVETRLRRLEDNYAKYAEALDFLNKVYAQQKAQQQAQQREEAAPDAMFAVDITPNLKAGMVEGSPQALVTIVEAWDFA